MPAKMSTCCLFLTSDAELLHLHNIITMLNAIWVHCHWCNAMWDYVINVICPIVVFRGDSRVVLPSCLLLLLFHYIVIIVRDPASILNALLLNHHATILRITNTMLRTQYQRLHISKHNQETMYLPPLNDLCLDLCWTFTTHELTFLP